MAGYELIDDYLESLRPRIGWHRKRRDVNCELRDHLYSTAEALEQQAVGHREAQRQALDRFGDSGAVAAAFASTGSRGLALPTRDTRTAGRAAVFGAGAWLTVAAGMSGATVLEETSGQWEGAPQALFVIATIALIASGATTVHALFGLDRRHGGLGLMGQVGIGLSSLGAVAGLVSWFIFGWGALLGAGMLLIAMAMLARDLAPRLPTLLFGSSWWIGGAVYLLLWRLEVGHQDEWGDYPVATAIAITTGALLAAAGLLGLGLWLTSEEPQPIPSHASSQS